LKFTGNLSPEKAAEKRKLWNKNTKASDVQVLDNQADFVSVGSKLSELESGDIREQNEARICGVFGVPARLVGAYVGLKNAKQNATAKSELKDFYLNKISPELKLLREWATWFLLPMFEDLNQIKAERIRVNWDLSQMLALMEETDAMHDRERADFAAGGITLNEYRAAIGKAPDLQGDYYLQPFNLDAISPDRRAQIALKPVQQGTNPNEPPKGNALRLLLKAATTHEFSSTQLDVPTAEKKILIDFGKSFIADEDLATDGREDKPHITIKYGLHTNNADDLKELLADIAPFEVVLGKTFIFKGKGDIDYDVVNIAVESPELRAVNKLISDNMEVTDSHPKYVPHLCIAYVLKGKGADYIGDETFDGQKILFDKITFSDKTRNKTVIKLTGAKSQKKTFEFDGLTLRREPSALEKLIGLKSLADDLTTQSENLSKSLLKYRDSLITEAVKIAETLTSETIYTLTLSRNEKLAKTVKRSLTESFQTGQAQIIRELAAQRSAKNKQPFEFKDLFDPEDRLNEISDSVLAKIINEIQSRAVNIFTALKILGFEAGKFFDEMRSRLTGESAKFVDQLSNNSANAAIMEGRSDELENQSDQINYFEWSAILDKNTCQNCEDLDGTQENSLSDLPSAPLSECFGGSSCRCFIIGIAD
jgi:2'-5' RNA ligase